MIIRGRFPPLLTSNYVTIIKRNGDKRHLIGYTWIKKDSWFSYVTVFEYFVVSKNIPFKCEDSLNFANVSISFANKTEFFVKNSTFTQSNSMRTVLEIF